MEPLGYDEQLARDIAYAAQPPTDDEVWLGHVRDTGDDLADDTDWDALFDPLVPDVVAATRSGTTMRQASMTSSRISTASSSASRASTQL
jgi:hypothetical protein